MINYFAQFCPALEKVFKKIKGEDVNVTIGKYYLKSKALKQNVFKAVAPKDTLNTTD